MSGSHYFEQTPEVASEPRTVRVLLPDTEYELVTDRGVFSHGAIDTGTRLLLLAGAVPENRPGNLLDLGCGAGAIALALARRAPSATVWAIDVNDRALDLCRQNTERNTVTNVRVCRPEEVPPALAFDGIWSNPPIRIGKQALHDLLATWLDRLVPPGEAHLVVQKHLGADSLARWLAEQGWTVSRRASRQGFRLLDVRRSPTDRGSDAGRVDLHPDP